MDGGDLVHITNACAKAKRKVNALLREEDILVSIQSFKEELIKK